MKKFLLIVLALAAAGLGIYYMIYFCGFYIPKEYDQIQAVFAAEGKKIVKLNDEGAYEEFCIKGVELSSSMPGHYANEFYPDKSDYLRWLTYLGEMGANTVKVSTVMDDDFYNAFYEYNSQAQEPLYLLQVIPVSDVANYGTESAYNDQFVRRLIRDGKDLVDIIHGRKSLFPTRSGGSGTYRRDISKWVLGFVAGSDWNPDLIAYTDHYNEGRNIYEGTYFKTTAQATPFEAVLARIMDEVTGYETKKYGEQRLMAFASSPETDFLEYDENYAIQLNKYTSLDPEHIEPGNGLNSGYVAAYRLFDYCEDFSRYLSLEQKAALGDILENLDTHVVYDGYLELLGKYHTMPVISCGYGLSTARGLEKPDSEPLTETMQGERLMEIYEEAVNSGWSGLCISFFQDTWEQTGWNTAFSEDVEKSYLWWDVQTPAKNYGLMAFEPGKDTSVCVVDGNIEEWSRKDQVFENNGIRLYAKYDWKCLYLMIDGIEDPEDSPMYIPLDLCDQVGRDQSETLGLTFDRNVDFVICINGTQDSRLLVYERYQASRENFYSQMVGEDPFISVPDAHNSDFVPVIMALENNVLIEDYASLDPYIRQQMRALGQWETGRLVYGNGDPGADDYNSLADFCFGDQSVEIRLPWLLINVGDPSDMSVHEDYYEHYGVELKTISRIWMGVSVDGETVLKPFRVKGTGTKLIYHERLKDSYDVISHVWGGGSSV